MQNMKKILSIFSALSFVTVAGVSAVACNKTKVFASMNSQVLTDLELYDKDGKSQVEATLYVRDNSSPDATVSWDVSKIRNLKASKLLTAQNNAQSKESFDFLTSVLKLEAKGDGEWKTKTFEKDKADAISLDIISVDPVLKAIDGDYAISKGTVTVQWKEKDSLGSKYSINLKADEAKGVVKESLPGSNALALEDFDTTKGVLENFAVDKDKSAISVNADITSNLKTDTGMGKIVSAIAKKIAQPLKLAVTEVNAKEDKFAEGDSLTVKISLGSVQFGTGYTLTLE